MSPLEAIQPPHSTPPPAAPVELSAVLLRAEATGQLPAAAWPAVRELLLTLAEAHDAGEGQLVAEQLDAAIGPLRALIAARAALTLARQALDRGYATLTRAGDDPTLITDAAGQLAALADDVAARAQQLAALST